MPESQHLKGCQGEDGHPKGMEGATERVLSVQHAANISNSKSHPVMERTSHQVVSFLSLGMLKQRCC